MSTYPPRLRPTFKLFFDANYRPRADFDDPAFWNRVRAIPFEVTVPAHEIDPRRET
jgi:putative DNA primase/helicase